MEGKACFLKHLRYLQTPSPIWRPFAFDDVVATVFFKDHTKEVVKIPGRVYSEYRSGPNLQWLAAAAVELLKQETSFDEQVNVGLTSCRYVGSFSDGKEKNYYPFHSRAFTSIPNARFWTLYKGSPVKITLRPGESFEDYDHRQTEEGFCSNWEKFTHEGDRVLCEWVDDGRDCDGRQTIQGESECRIDLLNSKGEHPSLPGSGMMISPWEKAKSEEIYDEFAQKAGY